LRQINYNFKNGVKKLKIGISAMYVSHPLNFPARAIAKLRQQMRGFTMIELMMALLVVAILAAIAVPSYKSYIEKSRLKVLQADLVALGLIMEQAYQKNLSYPSFQAGTPPGGGYVWYIDLLDAPHLQSINNFKPTQDAYFRYYLYTDTVSGQPKWVTGAFSRGPTSNNTLDPNCWIQLVNSGAHQAASACNFPGDTW